MKILIADDDPQIVRALTLTLGAVGYDVATASDGAEALRAVVDEHPDVVMVDLGMPLVDGLGVIEGLRGWSNVPVLVVSGRAGAADKVEALDAGADDYITKPFAMDELLARLRALTRRTAPVADDPSVAFGDIRIDFVAKSVVRVPDHVVRLTPTEWRILEILVRNPGRLVTREDILTRIWGPTHANDGGYLRLYVSQLRKKLEAVPARPRHIETVPGMGYRFAPEDPPR
jgi:two-component system KDP operon response regulator KdpE